MLTTLPSFMCAMDDGDRWRPVASCAGEEKLKIKLERACVLLISGVEYHCLVLDATLFLWRDGCPSHWRHAYQTSRCVKNGAGTITLCEV
jgi:hypothetical protein